MLVDDTILVVDGKDINRIYHKLIMAGFTTIEASNFVAIAMGLKTSDKGWKIKELNQLMFLKIISSSISS